MTWNTLPSQETVNKTVEALKANGISAVYVQTGAEAKAKVLEMLPQGAEVMTMTSVTVDTVGLSKEINESKKYNGIRSKLMSMDQQTQQLEMQKLGAAPEWAIGSVHAVTQDGKVFVASATGSQLPAYAYGSSHVIWVVGAQKIVGNMDDAMKRLYDYTLPLESERAKKAYGVAGSSVSKILIFNKEFQPSRITMIFVNEVLGF